MALAEPPEDCFFLFGMGELGAQPDPSIMGTKGANLAKMAALGLPVPPGFVLSAKLGQKIAAGDDALSSELRQQVQATIGEIENKLGRDLGNAIAPLTLSVRSGAEVSMPGMMDTVLNLGLNSITVDGVAKESGDERFAWDSYRRFVQSFSQVVLDLDSYDFEDVLDEERIRNNVETDADLSAEALKRVTETFLEIVEQNFGEPFPQDVFRQLDLALLAVFNSWNTSRAVRYRDMHKISHEGGTAAIIQAMVFGNRDENSCTGVYFTRNPSTGEAIPYGEYMPNAQGEDVVSGIRTPMELTEAARTAAMSDNPSMEKAMPQAFDELIMHGEALENHFSDMQEIEFTVESGNLFLLQTRSGKRTPKAGLKIAVELVNEGKITKQQAVASCNISDLEGMLVSKVQPKQGAVIITKGLPASPGAACGKIVFSSHEAEQSHDNSESCILVRPETDPKDVHGMHAATGILTTRGGMTSHAAVVARGMGKPCITAAMSLKIDPGNHTCTSAGQVYQVSDTITIDGSTGLVYAGEQPIVTPEPDGELAILLHWVEELAK